MTDYDVALEELRLHVDPLTGDMWKCPPITVEEVRAAMIAGVHDVRAWGLVKDQIAPEQHRAFHIARIAALAREPIAHGDHPILIAIAPDRVWVFDGNHRIAAALVRGQSTVRVRFAPSDPALIPATFPSAKMQSD